MNDDELKRIARNMVLGIGAALMEHADLVAEYALAAHKAENGATAEKGKTPEKVPPVEPEWKDARYLLTVSSSARLDDVKIEGNVAVSSLEGKTILTFTPDDTSILRAMNQGKPLRFFYDGENQILRPVDLDPASREVFMFTLSPITTG